MFRCSLSFEQHVGDGRSTTRTMLKGEPVINVEIAKIEFTNKLGEKKVKSNEPVLLIPDGEKFYILDGNHRVFNKLKSGDKMVSAYVLKKDTPIEKIAETNKGYGLPSWMRWYKEGKLSYEELLETTKRAVVQLKI